MYFYTSSSFHLLRTTPRRWLSSPRGELGFVHDIASNAADRYVTCPLRAYIFWWSDRWSLIYMGLGGINGVLFFKVEKDHDILCMRWRWCNIPGYDWYIENNTSCVRWRYYSNSKLSSRPRNDNRKVQRAEVGHKMEKLANWKNGEIWNYFERGML